MTLWYAMFTSLCTFSACYAMRSDMSQINEHDDDDDDDKSGEQRTRLDDRALLTHV